MSRLVVALAAEARPLIRHFSLTGPQEGEPFPRYRGEGLELVVSGIGKVASAAAVAWLEGRGGGGPRAWINVGIAGHRDRPLGEGLLADKVTDRASGRCWYPQLVFEPPCETAQVVTVEKPELGYPGDELYEMEAAGFVESASRFATAELIQVFKIVSDNRGAPARRLPGRAVEALVRGRLGEVERILEESAQLASELAARAAPPAELATFLARWRFTVTERRRLERLLRRLETLEPGTGRAEACSSLSSAGEVLRRLEDELAGRPPRIA